jgi:hypothetical protein
MLPVAGEPRPPSPPRASTPGLDPLAWWPAPRAALLASPFRPALGAAQHAAAVRGAGAGETLVALAGGEGRDAVLHLLASGVPLDVSVPPPPPSSTPHPTPPLTLKPPLRSSPHGPTPVPPSCARRGMSLADVVPPPPLDLPSYGSPYYWQVAGNPPPLLRTKWTRRVPHPVLIGHAASLIQVAGGPQIDSCFQIDALRERSAPPRPAG